MSERNPPGISTSTLEIYRHGDFRVYRGARRDLLELGLVTAAMLENARHGGTPVKHRSAGMAPWSITRLAEQDRYELVLHQSDGAPRGRRLPLRLASNGGETCSTTPSAAPPAFEDVGTDELLSVIREYTQLGTATLDLIAAVLRRAALDGHEREQITATITRIKRVYQNLELRNRLALGDGQAPAQG